MINRNLLIIRLLQKVTELLINQHFGKKSSSDLALQ